MSAYHQLTAIMEAHPDLVFCNDGYQNLPAEIVEANKETIQEIEKILKEKVWGFVSFQNFKPRKDGSMAVRYQARYDENTGFVGVVYTPLAEFQEKTNDY